MNNQIFRIPALVVSGLGIIGFCLGIFFIFGGIQETKDLYYRSVGIGMGLIILLNSVIAFSASQVALGDKSGIYKYILIGTLLILFLLNYLGFF